MNNKKDVILTSIKTYVLLGSVLTLINHGTTDYQQLLTIEELIKISLCYLIPFSVLTYSAA